MRRRILLSKSGGSDPSQAEALEVAFYDGSDIVIRKQADWVDGETPIGIVVVPGPHNRYGDGTCGIMSLVGMDYHRPETGIPVTSTSQTDNVTMYWGHNEETVGNDMFLSYSALTTTNIDYIPYQTNSGSTATSITMGSTTVWPYGGTTTEPTSAASTSYTNTDGYVSATTGKSGCDFNGIRNTAALYVDTRTSSSWTAKTVTNNYYTQFCPAAACAGRFKTIGTNSFIDVFSGITSNNTNYGTSASTKENTGFWYLPGEGELCYLPSKRFEINKIILALNQKYGNVAVQFQYSNNYWSSSECHYTNAWYMGMTGLVHNQGKNSSYYVRAFLRL